MSATGRTGAAVRPDRPRPEAGRMCGIGDEAAPGLARQLALHRELGFGAVELRTLDGVGLHELRPAALAAVVAEVAAAGLTVPVVDTPIGNWARTVATDLDEDLAVLERSAAAAHALGTRRLRVMSYPNDGRPEAAWAAESLRRMALLAREAERLDVVLLHENCQGWAGRGPQQTLRMLEHAASPALRLVFDVGNGLAYGYDAPAYLAAVLPYVDHVHVKDGRRTADGAVYDLPGHGEAHVAACVRLLEAYGYRGHYSLEPHVAHIPHLSVTADPEALEAGYRACAEAFRRLWAEVSGTADGRVDGDAHEGGDAHEDAGARLDGHVSGHVDADRTVRAGAGADSVAALSATGAALVAAGHGREDAQRRPGRWQR